MQEVLHADWQEVWHSPHPPFAMLVFSVLVVRVLTCFIRKSSFSMLAFSIPYGTAMCKKKHLLPKGLFVRLFMQEEAYLVDAASVDLLGQKPDAVHGHRLPILFLDQLINAIFRNFQKLCNIPR